MTDFSVNLTSIGSDYYQVFIKNDHFETDFIRIIIGYTEIESGKRVGQVTGSWIISPLQPDSERVFIEEVSKRMLSGRRLWIAFEAVKRNKPKNKTEGCFIALAPSTSKWHKTIGSATQFDIRVIDSVRRLEKSHLFNEPDVNSLPASGI